MPAADEEASHCFSGPLSRGAVLCLSLGGGMLMWIAQPPLRWWLLAWLAPVPWIWLVLTPHFQCRHPYRWIYLGGLLHWVLMTEGVRHPHIALYAGWMAMSLYLGLYLPLFVAMSRRLVHHSGWPIWIAAPAVWVALELARGYVVTGYSLGLLAHSQANAPVLIQVADLGGAYALSFVMMTVAAAAAMWLRRPAPAHRRRAWLGTAAALLLVTATIGYGAWKLSLPRGERTLKVALVQGDRDFIYEFNPRLNQEMYLKFRRLSIDKIRAEPDVGLVIWPESSLMAQFPEVIVDGPLVSPEPALTDQEFEDAVQAGSEQYHARLRALWMDVSEPVAAARGDRALDMIVGGGVIHLEGESQRHYNAALLIDRTGTVAARYYKMHPVMFGEYIPGGEHFPQIYDYTPMPAGLSRGRGPVPMKSHSLTVSASICFEITIPHLIRRQVATLRQRGEMPDVLVNPTNDSWFHGASILDQHRDCMVFRAVEHARPVLSAANGGMTVWVDDRGRVRGELRRRTADVLIAEIGPRNRVTCYQQFGDALAIVCLLATIVGLKRWSRSSPVRSTSGPSTKGETNARGE